MSEYGQDILESTDTLKGTWEYNDTTYDLLVEDIPYPTYSLIMDVAQIAFKATEGEDISDEDKEKVRQMDDLPWEDEYETDDFVSLLVLDKLVKPEVDLQSAGAGQIRALVEGMLRTWQESNEVADAKSEMGLDQGNG